MICAYLSKLFWHNSSIVCLLECAQRTHSKCWPHVQIVSTFAHFCQDTASPSVPMHPPQELMCGHICTRSSRIKIVHPPNSGLVYQLVLIGSHMFKFIHICKWFVGFYFLLPCILNWNFALGEIYQFKLFYLNATFTTKNWRERDVKKFVLGKESLKWPIR